MSWKPAVTKGAEDRGLDTEVGIMGMEVGIMGTTGSP